MRNAFRTASLLMIAALPAAAQVLDGASEADMRAAARTLVSIEQPLARGDVNGYCAAILGGPEYAGYVERACQAGVRNKVRQPEACTAEGIRQEIRQDLAECRAMSADAFEKTKRGWADARESFRTELAAKGVDAGRMLQEERAKLR